MPATKMASPVASRQERLASARMFSPERSPSSRFAARQPRIRRQSPGVGASPRSPASSPVADRFIPQRSDPVGEDLRSFIVGSCVLDENDRDCANSLLANSPGSGAAAVPEAAAGASVPATPDSLTQIGGQGANQQQDTTPARELYKEVLATRLFPGQQLHNVSLSGQRAGAAGPTSAAAEGAHRSPLREVHQAVSHLHTRKSRVPRKIATTAERLLDAPDILDDYYLNLLDWHATENIVAVALGESVYIWNADTSESYELCQVDEGTTISAVSFCKEGPYLAVGTSNNRIQIYDTSEQKLVARFDEHMARVASLDWHGTVLASGSRDLTVKIWDVMNGSTKPIATLTGHDGEVCGVRWSPDGSMLATGGNDNLLNVWSMVEPSSTMRPLHSFSQHTAAVKALSWCPWQAGLLASGGGTQDRTIRFWNTNTGACINHVDTKSQVCSLQWSRHSKELVSSHGYSQNQLVVWQFPSMTKLAELKGHTRRVLYMAMSPDGTTVASAAADETLRLWKVFEPAAQRRARNAISPFTLRQLR